MTLVVAHLTNKGETYVSIVSTTMLRMFFETNWWHVNNLTFVSLSITNLLNQEDLTIEICTPCKHATPNCQRTFLEQDYFGIICATTKKILIDEGATPCFLDCLCFTTFPSLAFAIALYLHWNFFVFIS